MSRQATQASVEPDPSVPPPAESKGSAGATGCITYERRGAGGWIILDNPDEMNAISPAWIAGIHEGLDRAEADGEVRAIVLTGKGKAFCAGADLKLNLAYLQEGPPTVVRRFLKPLTRLLGRIRSYPKPVIAAVNGYCLAGGLETVLCCDLVIASENAVLGDQHAIYGLLPAVAGAQSLGRIVGPMRAKEIMFSGDRYSARQMLDWGLVNKVVPHAELETEVQALVNRLAERSPEGLRRMKQMVNDEFEMPWEAATRYELSLAEAHLGGPDVQEGLQAFSQKRKPRFRPI